MTVRVVTAAQAAARDAAAIASGIPSRQLMKSAGRAAAAELLRAAGPRASDGILIFAGAGNNGGDAWVVAATLCAAGFPVHVREVEPPRTDDAKAEKAEASIVLQGARPPRGRPAVVVDGLLGTGARGTPRGAYATAIDEITSLRRGGAMVVALDLPSGLDATTGEHAGAVVADLTVSFGTIKRGHLMARATCGEIIVVDIGLDSHAVLADGAPLLVDVEWVRHAVPPIQADAHKGTRGKVAIVGGGAGMAGAAILAGRAASQSGAGLVKLVVDAGNLEIVQSAMPEALASPWPLTDEDALLLHRWADVLVIGPGLGPQARPVVERLLRAGRTPVLLDADALNAFAGDPRALGTLLDAREALLTPHPQEFARLHGGDASGVNANRFTVAAELAELTRASVLLKGVPTVVAARDGTMRVSASGTPVLGQGGSGDLLAGVAGTLLAQVGDATDAGAAAAWVHGRAAELAAPEGDVRGVTLDDVLGGLRAAWRLDLSPRAPHVLATLARVGERR